MAEGLQKAAWVIGAEPAGIGRSWMRKNLSCEEQEQRGLELRAIDSKPH